MSLLAKKLYYRKNGLTYSCNRYDTITDMKGKPYIVTKDDSNIIGYTAMSELGNDLSDIYIKKEDTTYRLQNSSSSVFQISFKTDSFGNGDSCPIEAEIPFYGKLYYGDSFTLTLHDVIYVTHIDYTDFKPEYSTECYLGITSNGWDYKGEDSIWGISGSMSSDDNFVIYPESWSGIWNKQTPAHSLCLIIEDTYYGILPWYSWYDVAVYATLEIF